MKKIVLLTLVTLGAWLVAPCAYAKKEKKVEVDSLGNKIKTGWNFGILPSVAYDADYGFQGGILTNIYFLRGRQSVSRVYSLHLF